MIETNPFDGNQVAICPCHGSVKDCTKATEATTTKKAFNTQTKTQYSEKYAFDLILISDIFQHHWKWPRRERGRLAAVTWKCLLLPKKEWNVHNTLSVCKNSGCMSEIMHRSLDVCGMVLKFCFRDMTYRPSLVVIRIRNF